MNKAIKTLFFALFVTSNTIAEPVFPQTSILEQIEMSVCPGEPWEKGSHSIKKTPPQIPNVYFDASASIVYFENPCYDCILELVVPGTDAVVFSYTIPDGDDTVVLPTFLSGKFELHIHRGNYCFWGVIVPD